MVIRSAVFIRFDTTCMSITKLRLLYDQYALQMQPMCFLPSGSVLYKVT